MLFQAKKSKISVAVAALAVMAVSLTSAPAYAGAPATPTFSFSSHDLLENGSVDWNITGDVTTYGACFFLDSVIVGCIPASYLPPTFSATWVDIYPQYGAGNYTIRLYDTSVFTDPTTITIDTPYTSGDYFNIAVSTTSVPDAVADLSATSSAYNYAQLDWTIPNDGGTQILSYKIYQDNVLIYTIDPNSIYWPQPSATTMSIGFDGLTKLTEYTYKVIAVNANGDSEDATAITTTPAPTFATDAVAHATVNVAYSANVAINWAGFTGDKISSVVASGLPAGLSFAGSCSEGCSYAISGTAATAGTYQVTLTMTLVDSTIVTTQLTVVVDGATVTPAPKSKLKNYMIVFSGDSASLTKTAKGAIRKIAAYAVAHGVATVQIVGYTHKAQHSNASARAKLGLLRAKAIAKALKVAAPGLQLSVATRGIVNKGRVAIVSLMTPVS